MKNNVFWDVTSPDYTSSQIRRPISSNGSLSAATNAFEVLYNVKDTKDAAFSLSFMRPVYSWETQENLQPSECEYNELQTT